MLMACCCDVVLEGHIYILFLSVNVHRDAGTID